LGALDRAFSQIKTEKGSLDLVVAGAGVVEGEPLAAATSEHFDRVFDLNARGTYFTVAKAMPLLNDGGAIVLISSGEHMKGFEGHGAYSASKAAVRSFARTWANELKGRGIRVNTLSPGAVETPMFASNFQSQEEADGARQHFSGLTPIGRLGTPEEMAAAALFLASGDSSYITGFDLIADGGFTQI
jgi:NAD(P)-dependent dehydrogenase (short-subunit alcohol dehydrogenase family)